MNLLLTGSGFQQPHVYQAFLAMLGRAPDACAVAIITTASEEWKARNKHAVATRQRLAQTGFGRVDDLDVEHEDPELLREFDAIFINGGNPFYLLHHLDRTAGRRVLCELAESGRAIVGSSAGAMVLGPDLSIASWFTPEMNRLGIADAPALGLVPFTLLPHYGKHGNNEDEVRAYEAATGREVIRLPESQAVRWRDGEASLVSATGSSLSS